MHNTPRTPTRPLAALVMSLALAMSASACQPATDGAAPADRSGELGASEAMQITIDTTDELSEAQLHAIAQYVEQNAAGDVAGAKVKVRKDGDSTALEVVLMGQNLGDGAGIEGQLKAQFPELASASISVGEAPADDEPMVHSDAEDPAVAEQEILEQLQEQGVEGEINVEVNDDEEGHRQVEVQVKKTVEGE